jgi:hypothetical protein
MNSLYFIFWLHALCGLVIRVPGYRSRGPGFDSWRYQIFWEVVGLERGPHSLVRIIEELLEWKVAAPGLENRDYGRGDPSYWPRDTVYQLKLALTSPTGCGRSVGIVRLRTKTTEFGFTCTLLCAYVLTVSIFSHILVSTSPMTFLITQTTDDCLFPLLYKYV